ncbi:MULTISPECIES: SPOR domain-containing protein [Hydrogenophaga]|uniref:Cell division protein n=1 Tax=Hydrogenophaga electricum TaxID=1230953 RepID=A0ABQ6C5U3_9BURK|nr:MULTISPECIES: SPOR domain-containing protein [Hydrogenophaga]GLS15184.1 cell division protein [Hydrogenophaga electricum]
MKHSPRPQRGGTLIGFVVGVLVGLAIALAVAMYVTRVPVPFVDRGVSRSAAQDAAEAERNKGWNPNAGLASKAPLPAAAPAPESGDPAVTAPGVAPAAAPAAPASSADPIGDLVQSRLGSPAPAAPGTVTVTVTRDTSAPASAATVGGAEPFVYFVQAGAFRSPEEAESQRARLAMMGFAANITEREQAGRPVFRVRVGPFQQKVPADATREQLESGGVEAALVRVPR